MEVKDVFELQKRKRVRFIWLLTFLVLVSSFIALCVGAVMIPPQKVLASIGHTILPSLISSPSHVTDIIVMKINIPRVLLALLTGCTLGIAGCIMQSTLRNPLVSPFTLGVSSAASFGAAATIMIGPMILGAAYYASFTLGNFSIQVQHITMVIFAFLFGMMSIMLVLFMGRTRNQSKSILILAGVVIGYIFQAGITAMKYLSDDATLREITVWLMGGMWGASWKCIFVLLPIVLVTTYYFIKLSPKFDAVSGGDEVAKTLGVDVKKLRVNSLVIVTLTTSACIAFTGVIGFIGLMAPHLTRMIIGNKQQYLIPGSALMGAFILVVSDMVSRLIIAPAEMPVGILMYVIGGVFFIYMITNRRRRAMV